MRTFEDTEPWAKNRIILGHSITFYTAKQIEVMSELEVAGVSDPLSVRLITAALITSAAIDKMMEKTI